MRSSNMSVRRTQTPKSNMANSPQTTFKSPELLRQRLAAGTVPASSGPQSFQFLSCTRYSQGIRQTGSLPGAAACVVSDLLCWIIFFSSSPCGRCLNSSSLALTCMVNSHCLSAAGGVVHCVWAHGLSCSGQERLIPYAKSGVEACIKVGWSVPEYWSSFVLLTPLHS